VKVMTIVGTRPEIIKLSRVIARLDAVFDHVLVHTGQNHEYEVNQIFFDEMGIRDPDRFLEVASGGLAETIGNIIMRADAALEEETPEALLVLGDTNSALSVIPAKRRHIPIFHMEAGNRSFDQRVPEETNRKIVDHVSDINLPYTEHARRYLLAEGLLPDRVIKTGSPMKEVLDHHREAIAASDVHNRLGVEKGGYFAASVHREENVDDPDRLALLVGSFNGVVDRFDKPMVVSRSARREWARVQRPDSGASATRVSGLRGAATGLVLHDLRQRHDHRGVRTARVPGDHHQGVTRASRGDG